MFVYEGRKLSRWLLFSRDFEIELLSQADVLDHLQAFLNEWFRCEEL